MSRETLTPIAQALARQELFRNLSWPALGLFVGLKWLSHLCWAVAVLRPRRDSPGTVAVGVGDCLWRRRCSRRLALARRNCRLAELGLSWRARAVGWLSAIRPVGKISFLIAFTYSWR